MVLKNIIPLFKFNLKIMELSNEEIQSKARMKNLKLVLVRAMESIIVGKEDYTYVEINSVLVELLNHNLSEELKGQVGNIDNK